MLLAHPSPRRDELPLKPVRYQPVLAVPLLAAAILAVGCTSHAQSGSADHPTATRTTPPIGAELVPSGSAEFNYVNNAQSYAEFQKIFAGVSSPSPAPVATPGTTGTLQGTLELSGVPGRSAVLPLVGDIQISQSGDNPAGRPYRWSVTTDLEGHFLTTVPAGSYSVVGSSGGFADGKGQCLPVGLMVVPVLRDETTTITVACEL